VLKDVYSFSFADSRMYNDSRLLKHLCKSIPLQAWTGLEVSRRLRLPDFKTTGT
jgi:hypothetical protein